MRKLHLKSLIIVAVVIMVIVTPMAYKIGFASGQMRELDRITELEWTGVGVWKNPPKEVETITSIIPPFCFAYNLGIRRGTGLSWVVMRNSPWCLSPERYNEVFGA